MVETAVVSTCGPGSSCTNALAKCPTQARALSSSSTDCSSAYSTCGDGGDCSGVKSTCGSGSTCSGAWSTCGPGSTCSAAYSSCGAGSSCTSSLATCADSLQLTVTGSVGNISLVMGMSSVMFAAMTVFLVVRARGRREVVAPEPLLG